MIRPAVQMPHTPATTRPLPRPRKQRQLRNRINPGAATGWTFRSRHAFLILIVLVAQAIFFSGSLFQVQRITVSGQENLSEKQILDKAALKSGSYLWKTSPAAVADRVARLQNIARVSVGFALPGEVHIVVNERQPAYQVSSNTPNPTWYAVDSYGLVLRKLKGTSNQWPRLKLEEQIHVGQRLHPALIATCAQACARIEQQFPASVWYYTLDQRGNLSFRTFSRQYPVDVQLGNLENLDQKLVVLRALLQDVLSKQRVALIDLRFPTPVVRLLHPPKPNPSEGEQQPT